MNVLISGAGPAGLTAAYWLAKHGHQVTVFEQAAELRTAGYMIDFAGSGWDVANRMGLVPELRRRSYPVDKVFYRDSEDRVQAELGVRRILEAAKVEDKYMALNRRELVEALYQTVRDQVDIEFGTAISALEQNEQKLVVETRGGKHLDFDLVLGCDGIHSAVRKQVFGPEEGFAKYLGYQFLLFEVTGLDRSLGNSYHMHVRPGLQIGVYPTKAENCLVFVGFSSDSPEIPEFEVRHDALKNVLSGVGWLVPEILAKLDSRSQIYWDTVTQIDMPRWHQGRVCLLGDAAHCPTLVSGQGASMAMAGAYTFAEALGSGSDYEAAFAELEAFLRPHIRRVQASARRFAPSFIPSSRFRIWSVNTVLKLAQIGVFKRLLGNQFAIRSILES